MPLVKIRLIIVSLAMLMAPVLLRAAWAYDLSPQHPRVLFTPAELDAAIARMYGTGAREPYQSWFTRIRDREIAAHSNASMSHDLMSLMLLYRATGESQYREWYLVALEDSLDSSLAQCSSNPEAQCGPAFELLISMDAMWGEISDPLKLKAFEASSFINAFYYHSGTNDSSQNFSYHGAIGRAPAFAFAAVFEGDPVLQHPEVLANPGRYSFVPSIYITAMEEELSSSGTFRQIENRIAGDPANNSALPGQFGGMYDNIGYDSAEDSWPIWLVSAVSTALGHDYLSGFLHEAHRGPFYMQLQKPYTASVAGSGQNQHVRHQIEVIWNTQTDWRTGPNPNTLGILSRKYRNSQLQYFADRWRKELATYSYDYYTTEIWRMLLFYDDSVPVSYPADNPTAAYFSGPGLVTMRENWSDDAAYAVFIAGEGISRRYEDANSFLLSRKGPIFVHAGARIRGDDDNNKHHWYHIRSASKNTLKIMDPAESFDVDSSGQRTTLHSGVPLVASDNLGGQLFETYVAASDGTYPISSGGRAARSDSAFPLGIWNTADIRKYEHHEGDFTYAMGDATEAYTRKIDFFEREFLFLRPDSIVIFDRVQSASPEFKKSWMVHTVDKPVSTGLPVQTAQGAEVFLNQHLLTISSPQNITRIHSLLPESNRLVIRGGDTILTSGRPLSNGTSINAEHIAELEVPRWLEVFAVGSDTTGSITIRGDAQEGQNVTEAVVFNGAVQVYDTRKGIIQISTSTLSDSGQSWEPNQWTNYMLRLRGGANSVHRIVSNTANTLSVADTMNGSGVYSYDIQRPLGNTYYHWNRIDQVSTGNMDLVSLTLSVPHYFDAEDSLGRLTGYAPHTDSLHDSYRKRTDLGQWNLSIETVTPQQLDNFLNVITMVDPGETPPAVQRMSALNAEGALINDRFAIFAKAQGTLSNMSLNCPAVGNFSGLVFNLAPGTRYYYRVNEGVFELSQAPGSGSSGISSSMGVLELSMACNTADPPPAAPQGLRVGSQ